MAPVWINTVANIQRLYQIACLSRPPVSPPPPRPPHPHIITVAHALASANTSSLTCLLHQPKRLLPVSANRLNRRWEPHAPHKLKVWEASKLRLKKTSIHASMVRFIPNVSFGIRSHRSPIKQEQETCKTTERSKETTIQA